MTLDEFMPMLGQNLLADCSPQPVELKLTAVRPLTNHARLDRPPFVLVFRTPPQILLVAGVYAMRCGDWGPDLIYIEQMAAPEAKDDGHFYQAVFN
jgi:hypothetical protein